MKKILILTLILVFFISGCGTSKQNATPVPTSTPTPVQTPALTPTPLGYINPLTGLKTATDISKNRPYAIMINNLYDALPQCGVGSADLIYEVAAEGGITRMVAVYQDLNNVGKIGSVRSTRTYYLDIAQGLDAILLHAGASTYAYDALNVRPVTHVDGIYNSTIYYRDESRMGAGYEHSLFTESGLVLDNIARFVTRLKHDEGYKYNMKFGTSSAAGGLNANKLNVVFSGYKTSGFSYNADDGLYYASQFDEPYKDGNTGKQIAIKNVLVLFAEESAISNDPLDRIDVNLMGSGTGLYACGGKYVEITWSKPSYDSQFVYKLKDGSECVFAPGKSYINIIAVGNNVAVS